MVLTTRSTRGWYFLAGTVIATVVAIGWARHESARWAALQHELVAQQRALRAAHEERERLIAAQPTPDEWGTLRTNAAAVQAARAELAALRASVAGQDRPVDPTRAPRLIAGAKVAIAECQQVGHSSPQSTLETALWAAAGGNVAAFAHSLLLIDSTTQREAAKLMATMPEAIRQQYTTPEQLIAFLTVRDIPLTSIQLRELEPIEGGPFPMAGIQLRIEDDQGKWAHKTLLFGNKGDGWKLVVTRDVIAKYAQAFATPTSVAAH